MSTYVPIQAITLSANATSVLFTNIPQTYTDLVVVCSIFSNGTADPSIQVNGDTGSNYSNTILSGNGSSASSSRNSNVAYVRLGENAYVTSATQGLYLVNVMNYSNSTTNKTFISRDNNAGTGVDSIVSLWRNTSAITSINVYSRGATPPSFTSGSTFTLYGVGTGSPKAFGGDVVTTDGTYWYHAFRSSGRFEPAQSINADILVIAGGAGGGTFGAGGAGGLVYLGSQSLSTISYTCTVGAGGARPNTGTGLQGTNGANSQFGSLTAAVGGGGGAGYSDSLKNGLAGGSGGGGAIGPSLGAVGIGGTGTSGQGNNGGNGFTSDNASGGGGGAGGAGATPTTGGVGAAGGAGVNTYSSWASATATGENGFYASGGAGSGGNTAGIAPDGGGGNGATSAANAQNGLANTGGGGGGGYASFTAGTGGSGIVIIRYSAV